MSDVRYRTHTYSRYAANFSTGYVPQGAVDPTGYPQSIYGTEVFEINAALQKIAADFARKATLNDSTTAQAYRANYKISAAASSAPSVRECDVATSDVYFSGNLLGFVISRYDTSISLTRTVC